MTGVNYSGSLCEFGEVMMMRREHAVKNKLADGWEKAIWVGRASSTEDHLCISQSGSMQGRSVKRRVGDERWSVDLFKKVRGLPWEPTGTVGARMHASVEAGVVNMPSERRAKKYEKTAFIEQMGMTVGCKACAGAAGARHTAACKRRQKLFLRKIDID